MAFPLRIASLSAFGGAAGVIGWLRTLARPGATLDVLLDGVPTAEAVRFDVNAGRYEVGAWDTQMWSQTDRMEGTLKLDVQPYGYWPTWITLASSASVGLPGRLDIPNASLFGDVSGLISLKVRPTNPTQYGSGSWLTDMIAWSLAAPSPVFGDTFFSAYWGAASAQAFTGVTATLTADKYAVSSQALQLFASQTQANWDTMLRVGVSQTIDVGIGRNAGRFRLFAYMRLGPSQSQPWQVSADVVSILAQSFAALGSAAPVATLVPEVASAGGSVGAFGPQPSPAYQLLDLGEIKLPAIPSQTMTSSLRLWSKPATSNVGVASPILSFGGFYLLPLDGPAGLLPRGLATPTSHPFASPTQAGFYIDGNLRQQISILLNDANDPPGAITDLTAAYRGLNPLAGASTYQLDLLGAGRMVATGAGTTSLARSSPAYARVSVRYQPRFLFVKGI